MAPTKPATARVKAQQRRLKAIAKLAEVKTINEDLRLEVISKLAGGSPADVESILDTSRVALFRCDDAAWDDGEELRALLDISLKALMVSM